MPSPAPRILGVVTVLAAAAGLAGACSGKTETSAVNDGGPPPDSDASVAPPLAACPHSEPSQDAPCTKDGLLCEYGDDYNPLCNSVWVCSSGSWARPIYYTGASACPSGGPPAVGPNPSDCAATRDAVPAGQACTTTSTCSYDGSTCSCGVFCPSYPIQPPECDPDAGITQNCCDKTKVQWNCFDGPSFCATPRPRVGTACTKDGDRCAVSPPVECGQSVLECSAGVWNVANTSCPISTARAKQSIAYVTDAEAAGLHDELMRIRLATYQYRNGDPSTHLGFIIEDMPQKSPAVMASRERVDLYGYVSMTVASLQREQREIDALGARLSRLEAENRTLRARCPRAE